MLEAPRPARKGDERSFVHQVADFLDGLAKGQPAQPDFRNVYGTQLVLDAILDSAKGGGWRWRRVNAGKEPSEFFGNREKHMGFFKSLFGKSWEDELAEAVFQDASEAFARLTAEHGHEHITAFAACTVDDACPPYYMGATLESGFGPVGLRADASGDGWGGNPDNWCWSDADNRHRRADKVHYSTEGKGIKSNKRIFDAMCRGLKRLEESGQFKGRLPRDQMVLMLWIHDPSYPSWAVEYAAQLNPRNVAEWFKVAHDYAGNEDAQEE